MIPTQLCISRGWIRVLPAPPHRGRQRRVVTDAEKEAITRAEGIVMRQLRVLSHEEFLTSHYRYFVQARWFVWRLLIERGMSYKGVGVAYGRDHATIIHGVRKLRDLCEVYQKMREAWEEIRKEFEVV